MSDPYHQPSVSVVTPTFNRRDRLGEWLDAVLCDPHPIEFVVVVDGCDDGSFELLEQRAAREPRLRPLLIANAGQFGAMQAGAEAATGEILVFIDDDVVPRTGTIRAHALRHAGRHGLVVLGYMPISLPEPRRPGQVATFLYAGDYEYQCREYERDSSLVLRNFWAGNFSMRRDDALAVGLSLPGDGPRFPYHPDRDFGLRCLEAGLTGEFDRDLSSEHRHQRSFSAFRREARARAIGGVNLHERHAAVIGPWRADAYEENLPRPAALAVRACREPAAARVVVPMVAGASRLAGWARWYKLESLAAIVTMHGIQVATVAELRRRPGRGRLVSAVLGPVLAAPGVRALHERAVHGFPAAAVVEVIDAFAAAGVEVWIAGGWGVDALAGRPSRAHHDLDLAVRDRDTAVAVLERLGYRVVDAYRQDGAGLPERVILAGPRQHMLDLHPDIDEAPVARGEAPFAFGTIAGRRVPCLSAAAQLALHEGYDRRPVDRRDVARLAALRSRTGTGR